MAGTSALFPIGTKKNLPEMASIIKSNVFFRFKILGTSGDFAEQEFILRLSKIAPKKLRLMLTKPLSNTYGLSHQYGIIGLVPKTAAAGDLVCLLKGCSKPIALHETEATNGKSAPAQDPIRRYQVIGQASVKLNPAGQAVVDKVLGDKDPEIGGIEYL
jgi:hypothetical protein